MTFQLQVYWQNNNNKQTNKQLILKLFVYLRIYVFMQKMEREASWKVAHKTSIQSNWHSNLQLIFDHLQKEIASPNAPPSLTWLVTACCIIQNHRGASLQNYFPSDLAKIHQKSCWKVIARRISTDSWTKANFSEMVEENKRVRIVRMNFIQVESLYCFL